MSRYSVVWYWGVLGEWRQLDPAQHTEGDIKLLLSKCRLLGRPAVPGWRDLPPEGPPSLEEGYGIVGDFWGRGVH